MLKAGEEEDNQMDPWGDACSSDDVERPMSEDAENFNEATRTKNEEEQEDEVGDNDDPLSSSEGVMSSLINPLNPSIDPEEEAHSAAASDETHEEDEDDEEHDADDENEDTEDNESTRKEVEALLGEHSTKEELDLLSDTEEPCCLNGDDRDDVNANGLDDDHDAVDEEEEASEEKSDTQERESGEDEDDNSIESDGGSVREETGPLLRTTTTVGEVDLVANIDDDANEDGSREHSAPLLDEDHVKVKDATAAIDDSTKARPMCLEARLEAWVVDKMSMLKAGDEEGNQMDPLGDAHSSNDVELPISEDAENFNEATRMKNEEEQEDEEGDNDDPLSSSERVMSSSINPLNPTIDPEEEAHSDSESDETRGEDEDDEEHDADDENEDDEDNESTRKEVEALLGEHSTKEELDLLSDTEEPCCSNGDDGDDVNANGLDDDHHDAVDEEEASEEKSDTQEHESGEHEDDNSIESDGGSVR